MITIDSEKIPIKIWADETDLVGFDEAIDQAKALANHPVGFRHVALMPDFHVGYGMPIGGVFAAKDAIIPNAVGVDIGCGMMALGTPIQASDLTTGQLQSLRTAIHQRVPVGFAKQNHSDNPIPDFFSLMPVISGQQEVAHEQMGTLGGGNHFIEIDVDRDDDRIWIMLHSGSRGIGHKVCTAYEKIAQALNAEWHSNVPLIKNRNELAFLPINTDDANNYLAEMKWCMEYAELNRHTMLHAVTAAFYEVLGVDIDTDGAIETHHNYAALERHYGQNVWVHRKGAVKADGPLIIPGSMGTASYICYGLNNRESFGSCSHGAGRVLGRKQANKSITHEQAVASMQGVVFGIREGDYEEMPAAYKDIDAVIKNQLDLLTPIHRLTPLAVVKG